MWADFSAHFAIDGAEAPPRPDRDGHRRRAEQRAVGDLDFDDWPEQTYQVKSRVQFQRMREIFFADETVAAERRRRLRRHVPPVQRRPRSRRQLHSRAGRRVRLSLPVARTDRCIGRAAVPGDRRGLAAFRGRCTVLVRDRAARRRRCRPDGRFDASYTDVDLAQLTDFYRLAGAAVGRPRQRTQSARMADGPISASIAAKADRDRAAAGRHG